MSALHKTAADVDRRGVPRIDTKRAETRGGTDDVGYGIDGADLVKVNSIDRNTVNSGLSLSKQFKGAQRECTHIRRKLRLPDQFANLFPAASMNVFVIGMLMPMMVLMVIVIMWMIVMMFVFVRVLLFGDLSADRVKYIDFRCAYSTSV